MHGPGHRHGARRLIARSFATASPMIRLAAGGVGKHPPGITIALGLKAVLLVTTVLGITGLWIAILADTGASVLVTLNASRLLGFDPDRQE